MKKIMVATLSLLACAVLLAGCNTSTESNEEQSLKVYSFSGENEYISVSNGVIILDGKNEICYGGDLKVISDDLSILPHIQLPFISMEVKKKLCFLIVLMIRLVGQ